MVRYITLITRPKGNRSDINSFENWHTMGHTNSLFPRLGQDMYIQYPEILVLVLRISKPKGTLYSKQCTKC
jgi:hypothetical protein